mgnify:CR=1 FL=1
MVREVAVGAPAPPVWPVGGDQTGSGAEVGGQVLAQAGGGLEGAKGVQLAEKGIESWAKRAWVNIDEL